MKAIKLLLASAVLAGAATLALAGPGPDYLARTKQAEKAKAQAKAKADNQAKTPSAPDVAASTTGCGCSGMKKS